jgi:hypothetical protein
MNLIDTRATGCWTPELKIRKLSNRLQLNERCIIRGFCEYVFERWFQKKFKHREHSLGVIPVLSSEFEREFSQIHLIVSPTRALTMTKAIYSPFLKIVCPLLTHLDPAKYADSWLLWKRHLSIDTNCRNKVGTCQTRFNNNLEFPKNLYETHYSSYIF